MTWAKSLSHLLFPITISRSYRQGFLGTGEGKAKPQRHGQELPRALVSSSWSRLHRPSANEVGLGLSNQGQQVQGAEQQCGNQTWFRSQLSHSTAEMSRRLHLPACKMGITVPIARVL